MENTTKVPVHDPDSPAKSPAFPGAVPVSVAPAFVNKDEQPAMPVASQTEPDIEGIVKFKLRRPLKVDGKELTELVLDFDGLPGDVLENVDDQLRADSKSAPRSVVWSTTYCLYLGARAARLHINDIRRLSFKDQTRVVNAVQGFFTNMDD